MEAALNISTAFEKWLQVDDENPPIPQQEAEWYIQELEEKKGRDQGEFLSADVEDEVVEDIDFDQVCHSVFEETIKPTIKETFKTTQPMAKGNRKGKPTDVLYDNIALSLTNYMAKQKKANERNLKEDLALSAEDVKRMNDFFNVFDKKASDPFDDKGLISKIEESKDKFMGGLLAKHMFVYHSGLYTKQPARATATKQLGVMREVSEGMMKDATRLLEAIATKTGGYGKMGPAKNTLGTFKKATRKVMGREKDTSWETLNFVNWPVKSERLCVSIKDIIRGTLIFASYDDMKTKYLEIAEELKCEMGDYREYPGASGVPVLGITKATTGFVYAPNATYRDMKVRTTKPNTETV